MRRTVVFCAVSLCLAAAAVTFTGCASQAEIRTAREVPMAKQAGVRVSDASFDTAFSREQYTILGAVTGEGTVKRRLVEVGTKETGAKAAGGPSTTRSGYRSYYVLDYDHTYGTWTDEGSLGVDAIGDKAMSQGEEQYVKQMETIAARIALYNALKANPEIDAVLSPRYEFSYAVEDELADKELIVARKVISVTARMRGKAIQIKNDEELYKTYTDYPELVRGPKQ
jgi:hypothetical protein